jgi:ketosteroid isomerase-like protein
MKGETLKSRQLAGAFGITLLCSFPLIAQSPAAGSQALSSANKIKAKDGKPVVRDKSKPVRKAIEHWYSLNTEAFAAKDAAAIMALRTSDFHTVTPDGRTNTRADMETRTRRFLAGIDRFISQDNQIGTIDVEGNLASADITQRLVRIQRFPDGTLHKVETRVVQRETWKKTDESWLLFRVDNIRNPWQRVDDSP